MNNKKYRLEHEFCAATEKWGWEYHHIGIPTSEKIPHLAFVVENLDNELISRDFKILTKPNLPTEGIRVAMIEHNGAPIELIEFEKIDSL